MNLGILVVYSARADDAALLRLHLEQIEKNTRAPFTLYASVNRLALPLQQLLAQRPYVKIVPTPHTPLRESQEHSFYLEQLTQAAIDDGASHLVSLHLDSFPIHPNWVALLDADLGDTNAFATVAFGPYTACLFFRRDFFTKHQPRWLISDAERESERYRQFSRKVKHILHSGAGYLFKAFSEGRSWHTLPASNRGVAFGSVYEGIIFHLHGVARLERGNAERGTPFGSNLIPWLERTRGLIRWVVPHDLRRFAWEHFGDQLQGMDWLALRHSKQRLLDDPDSYFKYFRAEK